jgi:hypothetical protein
MISTTNDMLVTTVSTGGSKIAIGLPPARCSENIPDIHRSSPGGPGRLHRSAETSSVARHVYPDVAA